MELHQLRYFCAVARAGNFTRAAEEQHVAQPSLSQQVRKLEDELGAKLFDRFPRFARLTDFGKAFLPKAGEILRRVGEARKRRLCKRGMPRLPFPLFRLQPIAQRHQFVHLRDDAVLLGEGWKGKY